MRFVPQRILRAEKPLFNRKNNMTRYRRFYTPGATWFFTVNLAQRRDNALLIDKIEPLRQAFRYVKQRHPFHIDAIVVLLDHLHCIWTLPEDDADFSSRWNLLKGQFSRSVEKGERVSASRTGKRERGIWQRRFWAHLITDQGDFNRHVDYIHWNPVNHGKARQVAEWPYSSFHHYARLGVYPSTWGYAGEFDFDAGE
jgi:putative transposase